MIDEIIVAQTRKKLLNPVYFRLFLARRLPMGFLSGMRMQQIDDNLCEVTMRHRWLIQNPFRSTFWAVLGMAAEMTTGALLMAYTLNQSKRVSFILIGNEAEYFKKARGKMRFVCNASREIKKVIEQAMEDGEKHELQLPSKVYNSDNELIAEMSFTWILQRRGDG